MNAIPVVYVSVMPLLLSTCCISDAGLCQQCYCWFFAPDRFKQLVSLENPAPHNISNWLIHSFMKLPTVLLFWCIRFNASNLPIIVNLRIFLHSCMTLSVLLQEIEGVFIWYPIFTVLVNMFSEYVLVMAAWYLFLSTDTSHQPPSDPD